MRVNRVGSFALVSLFLLSPRVCPAQAMNRITILYDAFGKVAPLRPDWGFAALVEYGGKRILFDTGNDTELFEQNVQALKVDLTRLDGVVISHRHGDHTNGLHYLLRVNPTVTIYAPRDEHFGGPTPPAFYQRGVDALPSHMRYFGGNPPEQVPHGTAWRQANIVQVDRVTEIAPNVSLIPTLSQVPGTLELLELSLSIRTPHGQVLVVGCSHPGIETILKAATAGEQRVALIVGGLHLVTTPTPEIERVATALHEKWHVDRIAPGHCTGEPAFAVLQTLFGDHDLYAGVGTIIDLP